MNTIAPGRIDTDRLREVYGPDGPTEAYLEQIPLRRLGTRPRDRGCRRLPRLRRRCLRDGRRAPRPPPRAGPTRASSPVGLGPAGWRRCRPTPSPPRRAGPARGAASPCSDGVGLGVVRDHDDHPPVHQQPHRAARHHRGGVLPAHRDAPDRVGPGLPGRPARLAVGPGRIAGCPGGDRRALRPLAADHDGAGAVLPRGAPGRPQDPALGRAAGVPVPAGRAAARRPAEPAATPSTAACWRRRALCRGDDRGAARRAAGALATAASSAFESDASVGRGDRPSRTIDAAGRPRYDEAAALAATQLADEHRDASTTSTGSSPTTCSARSPTTSP